MWGISHGYCGDCRALHRDRKDKPLCDRTNNEKCEVVKSYPDTDGEKQVRPFKLLPGNYLAIEVYERTVLISNLTEYSGKKKTGMYPTLSALPFIVEKIVGDIGIDEMDLLLDKIQIIHSVRLQNFIDRLQ